MRKETVIYSDGIPVSAYVFIPDMEEGEAPAVILCHGHSRDKSDGLEPLAERLCENGFVVVAADFRGCGSRAENKYHLYCTSEWPRDLINTIYYTQQLSFVDAERIGVAGISMGAATAVYVAGMDKRIRSAAVMAGIADCESWLEEVWKNNHGDWDAFKRKIAEDKERAVITGSSRLVPTLEMYHSPQQEQQELKEEGFFNEGINAFLSLDSIENLLWYKPVEKCAGIYAPIFFIHGGNDTLVAPENSKKMYAAVPSEKKKIKIYGGMGHNIPCEPDRERVFEDIAEWFLETL